LIDFNSINVPNDLTASAILSKIDDSQIFSYYFGYFELKHLYPSKLRRDRHPSTSFFVSNKSGKILYKDFATNEVFNCFTFVARLFNVSFNDALAIIARDFGLSKESTITVEARNILQNVSFDKQIKAQTIIQIIPSSWESEHISYWKHYHIDIQRLKNNNVYPVKRLFVNKAEFKTDKLCFAYLVKNIDDEGKFHEYLKIYQPLRTNETGKWINNIPISVPFGLYELKTSRKLPGDHIVIGKAKKDEMVLQSFFNYTIGTQNESESAISPSLVSYLHEHFPKRTIIWDSDRAGVESCKKFNDKGFGYFNTPAYLVDRGVKDVSDYVKAFGMKALERLLKSKKLI
jgi:hypothetical protein